MAAFHAACTEFDRRTRLGDDEARRLRIGNTLTLWTTDKVRSVIAGDFSGAVSGNEAVAMADRSRAELQELLVLTLRRDLLFEEASRDTRINEHFALAYPGETDPSPDTDEGADPALAAITAHKAAYATWLPYLKATSEAIPGTEGYQECETAAEVPRTREGEAYEALIGTPSTTLAGLLALADYLPGAVLRNAVVDDDDDGLRALSTVCSAINEVFGADADLIKLGQQFDALHAAWRQAEEANRGPAARCRAAMDRAMELSGDRFEAAARAAWAMPGVTGAHEAAEKAFEALEPICEEIFARPALTACGFAVKARSLIWVLWPGGKYEQGGSSSVDEDYHLQCARKFIESACAAAGVDWRGQPVTPSEVQPKA
ncbi:hypothetical protein ABS772_13175 [Methylorubrum podarium]|uniref:Uncharacterized protein n=1 Tax=Methylorubrum podarium TaxID=200476 RepID=A0ABV1QN65_9HYPH